MAQVKYDSHVHDDYIDDYDSSTSQNERFCISGGLMGSVSATRLRVEMSNFGGYCRPIRIYRYPWLSQSMLDDSSVQPINILKNEASLTCEIMKKAEPKKPSEATLIKKLLKCVDYALPMPELKERKVRIKIMSVETLEPPVIGPEDMEW